MSSSEYRDALAWLYALEAARGMDFKLERVALALKALGDPHKQYPCIHVAGTNGKGSVCAMLHQILGAAGYRSGLYVSPHLVSFTERIRVGAVPIGEEEVVALVHEIHAAVTVRGIDLTFFELVTVMGFLYFARQRVDLAVIEVGLGGRLDATNVIEPVVSVIVSIDHDHEEYLGEEIESITAEKCGIIKPHVPVVAGRVSDTARAVIETAARERQAPVSWAGRDFGFCGGDFSGQGRRIEGIRMALRGAFQEENAAVAMATILQLGSAFEIADDHIKAGLSTVSWPGRLEVVESEPMVIVDGAHNSAGVRTLIGELATIAGGRRIHLLFGVMRDKRWQPMVEQLAAVVSSVVVTGVLPPRGEDPHRLAAAFERHVPVEVATDPETGFEQLLQRTAATDAVLVAGSLFLVGRIYPQFSRWRQRTHDHATAGR
jgi:dihydrofolate synthase/folylpolyglutamate synthase